MDLIAVICEQGRSWLVFLRLLPGVWVLFMLVGEFLFPHQHRMVLSLQKTGQAH